MKLLYKGTEMAHVDEVGVVVFTKGPDLNPIIDEKLPTIVQIEDEDGNVILEHSTPPLEQKLIYLTEELGFTVVDK